ncbi:MAG TPA: hypothetical protein VNS34_29305 [Rhizobiaceae bacterium]|nr:hypothetical protein [Rhizobiaceae bacterium]
MLRFLFRLLATIALAIAVVMAVLDATRTVAASALVMTPLGESWVSVSPDTLAAARQFTEARLHPLLWDPVMTGIVRVPGFAVFGALALILYVIGHRPARRAGRFAPES